MSSLQVCAPPSRLLAQTGIAAAAAAAAASACWRARSLRASLAKMSLPSIESGGGGGGGNGAHSASCTHARSSLSARARAHILRSGQKVRDARRRQRAAGKLLLYLCESERASERVWPSRCASLRRVCVCVCAHNCVEIRSRANRASARARHSRAPQLNNTRKLAETSLPRKAKQSKAKRRLEREASKSNRTQGACL